MGMTFGSLFAGIGGFDLGLERAGMKCLWQVEKDPFCLRVLEKHWPEVKRYEDIHDVEKPEPVDVICGGFPCQPFSVAGKRGGKDDDRYLWPEMLRIIESVRPAWVICENVPGIINMALDDVLASLENAGYACQTFIVPACAVDAKHRRNRVWIVAHTTNTRVESVCEWEESANETLADAKRKRLQIRQSITGNAYEEQSSSERDGDVVPDSSSQWEAERWYKGLQNLAEDEKQRGNYGRRTPVNVCWQRWPPEPDVGRVADGVPNRVDRLRALGNAVVPRIPEIIGRIIIDIECNRKT